jgi:translocation and assembly module TamB
LLVEPIVKLRTARQKVAAAGIALCAALVAVFLLGIIALHTQLFRDWARQNIVAKLEQSLGTAVQIKRFELGLSPLTADLYGIVVRGNEPNQVSPLLRVQHLRVQLRWRPLLRKQVQIDEVLLEQPELFVQADANGHTNLPTPPAARSSSGLHVAISYARLRDGSVIYNDLAIPLSADVYGLQATLASLPFEHDAYQAELRYDHGRVSAKDFRALEHSLFVRAMITPSQCRVEEMKVAALRSQIQAEGAIDNYNQPRFSGNYRATIAGEDLGFVFRSTGMPAGSATLEGTLHYASLPKNADFLDAVASDGTFRSEEFVLKNTGTAVPVQKLDGRYTLRNSELQLSGLKADVLGGNLLSASDTINLKTNSGALQAQLRNVSLPHAGRMLDRSRRLPTIASKGRAQAQVNWQNGFKNVLVQVKAQFSSQGVSRKPEDIPLDGTVDASYDLRTDQATIRNSALRVGASELDASGTIAKQSRLNVRFATTNLHELIALASEQGAEELVARTKLDQLRGRASFQGTISGAVRRPQIEGRLTAADLVFEGSQWKLLQANLKVDSRLAQVSDSLLQGDQGRLQIAGAIPLADWKPDSAAPFSTDVKTQQLSIEAVQKLARTAYPIQGLLNANIHVEGSLAQPKGTAHLDVARGVIYGEAVNALKVDAQADAKSIHASAQAQSTAGSTNAEVTYEPGARRYEMNGEVQNLTPSKLGVATNKLSDIQGAISAKFSGSGTLDEPQLKATLQSPSLAIRGEAVKNIQAQVTLQNQKAQFELSSLVAGNSIAAKGNVALTGSYPATINVDTGSVNLGPLLQSYLPAAAGVSGDLELHLAAIGPLKEPRQMQAHLEIRTLHLSKKEILGPQSPENNSQDLTITNVRPIRVDYTQGTVKILDADLKGPNTEFSATGSVPLENSDDMDLAAKGHLDFKLLEGWISGATAAGNAQMQVSVRGTRDKPNISGNVQISNVEFFSDSVPVGIESLNGSATLQGKRIRIDKLTGKVGGGELTAAGTVDLAAQPAYALTLAAKSTRIRQNGVRAIVDTDLTFSGSAGQEMLGGRVVVRRLNFDQGSDLDSIIAQMAGDNTVSSPSPLEQKIKLNVAVLSEEELGLASSQLSVSGAANLQLIGTLAQPVVLGRVALTGGEVFFLGKRFALQNGTIAFANTARTNPILNMDVGTTIEQYNITIHLSGTLDKLKTTYTSDPSLSSADIINLLAFGQTTAEQQSRSTAPGSLGAESAIASAVGGQVAGQLQKIAGISQLTLDPLAGNSQNPGAQVAIQQRVTGNLLVTFSTDITSAQTQAVQLLYQAKPNVTVSILRDQNGGYGLDIRFHKVF